MSRMCEAEGPHLGDLMTRETSPVIWPRIHTPKQSSCSSAVGGLHSCRAAVFIRSKAPERPQRPSAMTHECKSRVTLCVAQGCRLRLNRPYGCRAYPWASPPMQRSSSWLGCMARS